MRFKTFITFGLAGLLAGCASMNQTTTVNQQPGTAFLGDDVLWRPREALAFHMLDELGTGFELKFTVRDMNTYVHAPAPVSFLVEAPDGSIVATSFLEDDGITGGNFKYQDGIYDPFADFRYRQYHRANSPHGRPPEKLRNPYLTNPEKLPARVVRLHVPASGKGLYRVSVCGRWDHWISVAPNRPLMTGVHPGGGPLYVHGLTLSKSFFYVPKVAQDIGLAITEEIEPYNWRLALKTESGQPLKQAKAQGFMTFMNLTPKTDAVYQLEVAGDTTGACLHAKGFPMVLCPDAATARKIHGGMDVDSRGRYSYHAGIRTLDQWSDSLSKSDLEVAVTLSAAQQETSFDEKHGHSRYKFKLSDVAQALDEQAIDPKAKDFGLLKGKVGHVKMTDLLAFVAGFKNDKNPYYGNRAVIRRVLLANMAQLRKLDPAFRFETPDLAFKMPAEVKHFFDLPGRSNWYGLGGDANHVESLLALKDVADKALPQAVLDAWKQTFRLWAYGRLNMHVGEVSNQWGYNFNNILKIYQAMGDAELEKAIRRHAGLVSTPNLYGRLNPDETPFDRKKGRLDTDCGLTPAGYMPEQMGFDGEYTCEQTMLWGRIWQHTGQQGIVDWFSKFNTLKTYLTLSKTGQAPEVCFSQTCSPTDLNFRTRYMTHKNHQPKEMVGLVDYLDLWFPQKGVAPAKPWPFLEKERFTKVVDDKYFFLKTPAYYAILFGGPRLPIWANWSASAGLVGDSLNFDGFDGSGYGSWGSSACKPGAISALYVKDCGPVLLGQNHTVMDSNTVWGKATQPLFKAWRDDVDPTEFASCYAQPEVSFNRETQTYRIAEAVPFVPLSVERTIRFKDRTIEVDVDVTAREDFTCRELNYSIPFFADKRLVTAVSAKGAAEIKIPAAVSTPSRPRRPDAALEKSRWNLDSFPARSISVKAANGAGITYEFDQERTIKPLRPFRYRAVAAAGGSFILPLPKSLKAGEHHRLSYTITIVRQD
jgi:hypothetical protein